MQERAAAEHDRELVFDAAEEFLDRGRVTDECGRHFETARGYGAEGCLNVVRDPFHEVGAIFVLDGSHLVFGFAHGDFTAASVVSICLLER